MSTLSIMEAVYDDGDVAENDVSFVGTVANLQSHIPSFQLPGSVHCFSLPQPTPATTGMTALIPFQEFHIVGFLRMISPIKGSICFYFSNVYRRLHAHFFPSPAWDFRGADLPKPQSTICHCHRLLGTISQDRPDQPSNPPSQLAYPDPKVTFRLPKLQRLHSLLHDSPIEREMLKQQLRREMQQLQNDLLASISILDQNIASIDCAGTVASNNQHNNRQDPALDRGSLQRDGDSCQVEKGEDVSPNCTAPTNAQQQSPPTGDVMCDDTASKMEVDATIPTHGAQELNCDTIVHMDSKTHDACLVSEEDAKPTDSTETENVTESACIASNETLGASEMDSTQALVPTPDEKQHARHGSASAAPMKQEIKTPGTRQEEEESSDNAMSSLLQKYGLHEDTPTTVDNCKDSLAASPQNNPYTLRDQKSNEKAKQPSILGVKDVVDDVQPKFQNIGKDQPYDGTHHENCSHRQETAVHTDLPLPEQAQVSPTIDHNITHVENSANVYRSDQREESKRNVVRVEKESNGTSLPLADMRARFFKNRGRTMASSRVVGQLTPDSNQNKENLHLHRNETENPMPQTRRAVPPPLSTANPRSLPQSSETLDRFEKARDEQRNFGTDRALANRQNPVHVDGEERIIGSAVNTIVRSRCKRSLDPTTPFPHEHQRKKPKSLATLEIQPHALHERVQESHLATQFADRPAIGPGETVDELPPPNARIGLLNTAGTESPIDPPAQLHEAEVELEPLSEDANPPTPPIHLVCSESFVEGWSEVVALLSSGNWNAKKRAQNMLVTAPTDFEDGRTPEDAKMLFIDSPLLEICLVDIEFPNSRAALLVSVDDLVHDQRREAFMRQVVHVASIGRYSMLTVFLVCSRHPIDARIANSITAAQNALLCFPPTNVQFRIVTRNTLPMYIAHLATDQETAGMKDMQAALSDQRTNERTRFLLMLVPTLPLLGAIDLLRADTVLGEQRGHPHGSMFQKIIGKSSTYRERILQSMKQKNIEYCNFRPVSIIQLSHLANTCVGNSAPLGY